jgi:hypothetical protein
MKLLIAIGIVVALILLSYGSIILWDHVGKRFQNYLEPRRQAKVQAARDRESVFCFYHGCQHEPRTLVGFDIWDLLTCRDIDKFCGTMKPNSDECHWTKTWGLVRTGDRKLDLYSAQPKNYTKFPKNWISM